MKSVCTRARARVCVCLCVSVFVSVRMVACMCVLVDIPLSLCLCVYMCMRVCVCVHVQKYSSESKRKGYRVWSNFTPTYAAKKITSKTASLAVRDPDSLLSVRYHFLWLTSECGCSGVH